MVADGVVDGLTSQTLVPVLAPLLLHVGDLNRSEQGR